jgi:hypothetical protein
MNNKITIYSKEDLTDIRLQKSNVIELTLCEYSNLFDNLKFTNNKAEELLKFICDFEEGSWIPEKCDAYEPIKEKFNSSDISNPLHWISQRGGSLYLKKNKPFKYTILIENERLRPIWKEDGKPLKSKVKEKEFLSRFELYYDDKIYKIKSTEAISNFTDEIKMILKTDNILSEII